jgi:hypothetical protein
VPARGPMRGVTAEPNQQPIADRGSGSYGLTRRRGDRTAHFHAGY